MKVIEIKKIALVQIVAAVYESKKAETTGFLGGDARRSRFIVEFAQPAQIVERKPSSIGYDNEWKRIREIISKDYDFIGGFHSHLKTIVQDKLEKKVDFGSVMLSETDLATIKKQYPNGIEIVVALNPIMRRMSATISADKITGCVGNGGGDNYKVEIGAYYLDESLRKRRAELCVKKRHLNAVF